MADGHSPQAAEHAQVDPGLAGGIGPAAPSAPGDQRQGQQTADRPGQEDGHPPGHARGAERGEGPDLDHAGEHVALQLQGPRPDGQDGLVQHGDDPHQAAAERESDQIGRGGHQGSQVDGVEDEYRDGGQTQGQDRADHAGDQQTGADQDAAMLRVRGRQSRDQQRPEAQGPQRAEQHHQGDRRAGHTGFGRREPPVGQGPEDQPEHTCQGLGADQRCADAGQSTQARGEAGGGRRRRDGGGRQLRRHVTAPFSKGHSGEVRTQARTSLSDVAAPDRTIDSTHRPDRTGRRREFGSMVAKNRTQGDQSRSSWSRKDDAEGARYGGYLTLSDARIRTGFVSSRTLGRGSSAISGGGFPRRGWPTMHCRSCHAR